MWKCLLTWKVNLIYDNCFTNKKYKFSKELKLILLNVPLNLTSHTSTILSKAFCSSNGVFLLLKEKMIENEVSILRMVQHPNIIRLIEDFDTQDELFLVMELVKVRVWVQTLVCRRGEGDLELYTAKWNPFWTLRLKPETLRKNNLEAARAQWGDKEESYRCGT